MSIAKTVQIHKCDNCGKEEEWNDSWYHKTYFHTSGGPGPWDAHGTALGDVKMLLACSKDE